MHDWHSHFTRSNLTDELENHQELFISLKDLIYVLVVTVQTFFVSH